MTSQSSEKASSQPSGDTIDGRIVFPLYQFFKILIIIVSRLYLRMSVRGARNTPRRGPLIIVSNHQSDLDPPLVGSAIKRPLYYMAKRELFSVPLLRWILPRVGSLPINRGAPDRKGIRNCLEVLKQGNGLLLFPEGTRSRDGNLKEAQPGVSMIIAQNPDVDVLPVRIEGSYQALRPGAKFPRPVKVNVTIGKPFRISQLKDLPREKKRLYQELGAEIMSKIEKASP